MSTRDALFGGRVVLAQPARSDGYRVNVDALLLADFARSPRTARSAFDLGAGVGAVSLALLHWGAASRVTLVEVDSTAAALARANLDANGWLAQGDVVADDVARVARSHRGEADLVVCNPPFTPAGRGRPPGSPSRARARSGDLAVFAAAARSILGRRGRACFVYPAPELVSLVATLRGCGLEPKRARAVRSSVTSPARIILVETAAAKAGGLRMEPDLVERNATGPTPELARIVAGE